MRPTLVHMLTLAMLLFSGSVFAQERNYLIEVLVFENMAEANKNSSGGVYFPKITSAIGLTSDQAASSGFALLDEAFALEQLQAVKALRVATTWFGR